MKTIAIAAKFATVLEALEASQIDISYNPGSARTKATDACRPNHHFKSLAVYLCEDGEIRHLIECFDGLRILNTFDPFVSCLDDSPFTVATITENEIQIHEALTFPKSQRKALAKLQGVCFV